MSFPLSKWVEDGDVAALAVVLSTKAFSGPEVVDALHQAVRLGDVRCMQMLVEAGASVESPGAPMSWRPLHTAVEHGQVEAVRWLVDKGADVNGMADDGMTPLHLAVDVASDVDGEEPSQGSLAVIRLLLQLGASPGLQDDYGRSPHDWALDAGGRAVIECIIHSGQEPPDSGGQEQI